MDNYEKIKELRQLRRSRQLDFFIVAYLVVFVGGTIAAEGNYISGFLLSMFVVMIFGPIVRFVFEVYDEHQLMKDCKLYLTEKTYKKLVKDKKKYDAEQAKQEAELQNQELLTPAQKTAVKAGAAGYIGYKVGKKIASW